MKTCAIRSTESAVEKFLSSRIDSAKKSIKVGEEKFLSDLKDWGTSTLTLNIVKSLLNGIGIYSYDDYIDGLISDVYKPQLYEGFAHWDVSSSSKAIRLFRTNSHLQENLDGDFLKDAIKYCVVDTSAGTDDHLIQTLTQLKDNIAAFKQNLIAKIIPYLNIVSKDDFDAGNEEGTEILDENEEPIDTTTLIFDPVNGADGEIYNAIMEEAQSLLQNYQIHDLTEADPDEDLYNIIYGVYSLVNFDTLLEKSLEDVIEPGKAKKGDLSRVDYSIATIANTELQAASIIADNAHENSANFMSPSIKLIIPTIPVVTFTKLSEGDSLRISKEEKLALPEVQQFSQFLQINLDKFKELYDLPNLDLQRNPISTLKRVLKAIHDSAADYKNLKGVNNPIKNFLNVNSNKLEISTALSLYEYLFNDDSRLDDGTISINNINLLEGGFPKFNIIHELLLALMQTSGPAYFQYNKDGTLHDDSTTDSTGKNAIQKVRNNKALFAFEDAILYSVYTEGKKINGESEVAKSILDTKKRMLSDALKYDAAYLKAVKQLLNITKVNDDIAIDTLLEADAEIKATGGSLFDAFKAIAKVIQDIVPEDDVPHDYWLQVQTELNPIIKDPSLNKEAIGRALSPILKSGVNPVFMTMDGNMQSIFRTTTLMALHSHAIKRYKPVGEDEKYLTNYIPRRERTSFFAANPNLLSPGDNELYLSQYGVPLKMGNKHASLEARKLPEYTQDLHAFVGEYMSLMMGAKNAKPMPTIAYLLGTYSDKTLLLQLILNSKEKLKGGITLVDLARDRELLLNYVQAYQSAKSLDLVNHVISDWKKVLTAVIHGDYKGDALSQEVIDYLKEHEEDINNIKTISADLTDTNPNSHAKLFEAFLENPDDSIVSKKLMRKCEELRSTLEASADILNGLFLFKGLQDSTEDQKKRLKTLRNKGLDSFISRIIPQVADDLNLQIVKELHVSKYDKSFYLMNRMMLFDLKKDCTRQNSGSVSKIIGGDYSVMSLDEIAKKSGKNKSIPLADYYRSMAIKALLKTYSIQGKAPLTFLSYLHEYFGNKETAQRLGKMCHGFGVSGAVNIFKSLYTEHKSKSSNGESKKTYTYNPNQLVDIYTNYLILTDFLRHQALEVGVKEAYLDKSSAKYDEGIEAEISSRQQNTTKRNNTYTATIIPFIMDLVKGVSQKTRICMISDIKGGVMNSIGADNYVTEFDGLGLLSPIQVRMEDASLAKNHRVSTKKTFVTLLEDFSAGELKWASNEITNKKIRESMGCKISLLSIFKRMHNRPVNFDFTNFWMNGEPAPFAVNSLLNGEDLYMQDGFHYYKLGTVSSNGDGTYQITKTEVDVNGKEIGQEELITDEEGSTNLHINSLYDMYKYLGGPYTMSLTKNGLEYSESIMDFLYELTCNVGEYDQSNPDLDYNEYSQSNIKQPLRDGFVGILATEGSNKRGIANMISGDAWFDDSIPLSSYKVELATGGEQLSAEHEADGSEITKGTQLMQVLAQNAYTAELVERMYQSIARVMEISSPQYNKFISLVNDPNSTDKLRENICNKIVEDLELSGLTDGNRNLIQEFQRQLDYYNEGLEESEKIKISLPLSLMVKDLIKSYAPELNKKVIKQQDAGLMGTLNGSSGFIQVYNVGGKVFTAGDILKPKVLDRWKPNEYTINAFCKLTGIPFNEVIRLLYVLSQQEDIEGLESGLQQHEFAQFKIGDDPKVQKTLFALLQILTNHLRRVTEAYNAFNADPNLTEILGFRKIHLSQVQPGLTIIDPVTKEKVLIDSVGTILKYNMFQTVLVDSLIPMDLQPQIMEVTSLQIDLAVDEDGAFLVNNDGSPATVERTVVENEYTSKESLLGARLNRIAKSSIEKPAKQEDLDVVLEELNYIASVDTDKDYSNIIELVQSGRINDKDYHNEMLELYRIQEDLANFKNHVKAFGFNLNENNPRGRYGGFNPRKYFEYQLQRAIVENEFYNNGSDFNSRFAYYKKWQTTASKKATINSIGIDRLVKTNPEFLFKALGYNEQEKYRECLSALGFNRIISSKLSTAQIIMPNITRGKMRLGNIDVMDVDLASFSKFPSFYKINPIYLEKDGTINVDFIARSFKGLFGIVVVPDITDKSLDKYGAVIDVSGSLDEEGYRIDKRTKQRLYKMPPGASVRKINGLETLIIKINDDADLQAKTYQLILELAASNSGVISIQPFITNILRNSKINPVKLSQFIEDLDKERVNTLSTFSGMFEHIQDVIGLNPKQITTKRVDELIKQLSLDYVNEEEGYKDRFRESMKVSFLRSLDVIASRIPTQNMSSVMTMKIAAFTKSDINDVFVTKWQQWLLGAK